MDAFETSVSARGSRTLFDSLLTSGIGRQYRYIMSTANKPARELRQHAAYRRTARQDKSKG